MVNQNPTSGTRSYILLLDELSILADTIGGGTLRYLPEISKKMSVSEADKTRVITMSDLALRGLIRLPVKETSDIQPELLNILNCCLKAQTYLVIQTYGLQHDVVYIHDNGWVLQTFRGMNVVEFVTIPGSDVLVSWYADALGLTSLMIGNPPKFSIPAKYLTESALTWGNPLSENLREVLLNCDIPPSLRNTLTRFPESPIQFSSIWRENIQTSERQDMAGFIILELRDEFWLIRFTGDENSLPMAEFEPTSAGKVRRAFLSLM